MRDYNDYKLQYFSEHKLMDIVTGSMDEYGRYLKTYICEDGAVLNELTSPHTETVIAKTEAHGLPVTIEQQVKFWKIEVWTTHSKSVYFYERW